MAEFEKVRQVKTWAESWGDADRTCGGDLPSVHSLPHMSERAATFAANATGPAGELPKVEPTFIRRVADWFKTSQHEADVARLQKLISDTLA
jgi:hypothetical protein